MRRFIFYIFLFAFLFNETVYLQVRRGARKANKDRGIHVALDGTAKYTSIQKAIDEAEFNATIRIKAGVYRERILMKNFVNIEGEGAGRTVLTTDGSSPVIEAYNLGGGRISGLSVEFSEPSDLPLILSKFSTFSIESCTLRKGGDGIDMQNNSSVNIRQTTITENRRNGLTVRSKSHGYIFDCVVSRNGADGLFVSDNASPTIEKNVIRENGRNGITITAQSTNKILGNFVFLNRKNGIQIDGRSSPLIRNNTIAKNGGGNRIEEESGHGVLIRGTTAVSVLNNILAWNRVGAAVYESKDIEFTKNNVWDNDSSYVGLFPRVTDLNIDPLFLDPANNDFRIDSLSKLYRKGVDEVSIGAHYDNTRIEKKRRLDYLKTQATKDIARENWFYAYQSAQEILTIDKDDTEGKTLFKKAGEEMAKGYAEKGKMEFSNGNIRVAENYLKSALKYDPDNTAALELQEAIDDASFSEKVRNLTLLAIGIVTIVIFGLWWKKRIQIGEIKRQVQWWLDDSEEQIELARAAGGDTLSPEDFGMALRKQAQAKAAFEARQYESCEALCNEATRHAMRAKDDAEKQKQVRKDAHLEVSNAEVEMQHVNGTELNSRFREEIKEFSFYLERAQDALIHKQYMLAKEIAEDIQSSLKKLRDKLQQEKDDRVRDLITETEKLIIEALASNNSADIIIAVIDFKAELEILKNGFQNGQLHNDEVMSQLLQIKEFIAEALRLAGQDGSSVHPSRKKNYYEILGVKEGATLEQIKAVYRKLSMIYHPDMDNAGEMGIAGDERFKEIKEAYEVLISEKSN